MPAENVTGDATAAEAWLARQIVDEDTPPTASTPPVAEPDLAGIAPGLADPDDPVVLPSPAVVESDPAALVPNAPDLVGPAALPTSAVEEAGSTGSVPPVSAPSLPSPGTPPAASPAAGTDAAASDTSTSTPDAPPPPAMPEPDPETEPAPDPSASTPETAEPKPTTQEPMAASTANAPVQPAQKTDGWEVDPYQLRSFTDAVERARSYLDTVRTKVDRMQGAELTPQLGTSPVGQQLAKKFDDRLNSPDGLRARLAEAMKRMENFVTSAEKVARTYEDPDQEGADRYGSYSADVSGPPGKS